MSNEIVFEDLHGLNEDQPVTIDLDADTKDAGITQTPADEVAGADAGHNDTVEFDELRSADNDAPTEIVEDKSASSDSEDDGYSKKVKARIQRATRATSKERERGDYWESEAKRLAKSGYDSEKQAFESVIEQADAQIGNTQDQLEAAIEAGNTKDQVKFTSQLTDQKAAKIQAEVNLNNLAPDGNVQPFSGKVTTKKSSYPNKSDDWMESRNDWYRADGFERQTRLANRLDKEVFADGYDPATDDYFEELDRRFKEKEPSLYDDEKSEAGDTGDRGRGKPKTIVADVGGATHKKSARQGNKVELGEEDFANMRRFNLDPNDPEVLKEYARNKQESNREGDQR